VTLATAVLGSTAVWHGLAAWHFTLFPERTLRRTTLERPPNAFAAELFRFLGALNFALAAFALLLIFAPANSVWMALAGFSALNLSQFAVDLRVQRLKMAHGPMFKTILAGDGAFFALNAVAAFACAPR
jgi:hypothetical protein